MHTLLIDGVAIAVTDADREDAEALFTSDGFKDDLKSLTVEGRPLWDGVAAFTVREASEDEVAVFDDFEDGDFDDEFGDDDEDAAEGDDAEAVADDEADEDEDEDDEDAYEVMFLVPIDQFPEEG